MLSNALFGRGSDKVNACPSTSHSGGVGEILHTNQRPVRAGFWKRHYDVSQVAIFVNHVQQLTLVPFLFRPGATLLCQYSLPRRERACQHQELRPQDYQQISAACRLQLDTRNCRIGAKNQRSRALGLIDAGRTAPPRARQSVLSECADSMYRGMGCVVLLTTCYRSQYRLTAEPISGGGPYRG